MSVLLDMAGAPILDMAGAPILDMAGSSGSVAAALPAFAGGSVASVEISGSIDGLLPAFSGSATGAGVLVATGTVSGTLPAFSGSATGGSVAPISAIVSGNLPGFTGTAIASTVEDQPTPEFRIYTVGTDAESAFRLPDKDPADVLDYAIDFAALLQTDEAIAAFTVTYDGVTEASPSPARQDARIVFWVSGGTAESDALATATITTNQGRTYERSIRIYVRDL